MTGSLKDDFVGSNPTLRPERLAEDGDKALRPKGLDEFIGQEAARANLKVFIQSARQGLVRPLWRRLWRGSWGSIFA
jgi:hypothetical protein